MLKKTLKGGSAPPALSTLSQFELLSVLGGPGAQAVRDCCRLSGMGKESRAMSQSSKSGSVRSVSSATRPPSVSRCTCVSFWTQFNSLPSPPALLLDRRFRGRQRRGRRVHGLVARLALALHRRSLPASPKATDPGQPGAAPRRGAAQREHAGEQSWDPPLASRTRALPRGSVGFCLGMRMYPGTTTLLNQGPCHR